MPWLILSAHTRYFTEYVKALNLSLIMEQKICKFLSSEHRIIGEKMYFKTTGYCAFDII